MCFVIHYIEELIGKRRRKLKAQGLGNTDLRIWMVHGQYEEEIFYLVSDNDFELAVCEWG